MKKLRLLIAPLVVTISLLAGTLPAHADAETDNWLAINSPSGYCGYASATMNNHFNGSFSTESATAETFVRTGVNPCSTGGSEASLPLGYLSVQLSIRCTYSGTPNEWVGYNSATWASGPNSGHVSTSYDFAVCDPSSPSTVKARAVVTSGFYVYPSGWIFKTYTTHWMNPS